MFIRSSFIVLLLTCSICTFADDEKPTDPFDYNFCGGERVYPIIGVNFSTSCGPRNQVALGRRGSLMWFFPAAAKDQRSYKGNYKLNKEQLFRLSSMAEVASITDNPEPQPYAVMYKMGINFSGRQPKYIYAAKSFEYTPSNELLKLLLSMVPVTEVPNLPDCGTTLAVFDPTLNREQRADLLNTMYNTQQTVKYVNAQ